MPWVSADCGVYGIYKPATQSLKLFSWDNCLLVRFKVLSITEATPSIHFKLMLTGRLLLLARDRSGWYSNCTHDVLSIDWLGFIDVGNEY